MKDRLGNDVPEHEGAGLRYCDCPICDADESLEHEEYADASYVICSECGAVIEAYEWEDEE